MSEGSPVSTDDRQPRTLAADVRRHRRWIAGGAIVVLVPVTLFLLAAATSQGRVPNGTTVEGVDIGGLSAAEAKARLTKELLPRTAKPVVVVADGSKATVVPKSAGVTLDVDATVDRAVSGRAPLARVAGLFAQAGAVEPVLVVKDVTLDAAVKKSVAAIDRPSVEGGIDFVGARAVPIEPVTGRSVDPALVKAAVLDTVAASDRTVDVAVTSTPTQLDEQDVQKAVATLGRTVVSGPVAIRVTGKGSEGRVDETVTVPIARLTPSLGTKVVDGALELTVDGPKVLKELQPDLGPLEVPAKDATFRIVSGKPVVVPSQDGSTVGKARLADAIVDAVSTTGARVAAVTLTARPAELTTAEAKKLGITERLSTFRQPFPYAPYRYQNIGQAAKRINGTLLMPGETFSLNRTVKERTPANGYTTGFVIKSGRLAEDLGGGVSTSATATWHAAFYAGLERVEQRAHSFYISRYQAGLEATVAWGSLDLRFKNDSPNGVFITAESGRTYIRVSMYGTKRYEIEADSGPRTDVKPYKSVTDTSATCTPQSGVAGFRIVVTRVFKVNGEVVKREPLTTKYNPASDVTCKKPTPKPSATPSPTGTAKPKPTPKPTG